MEPRRLLKMMAPVIILLSLLAYFLRWGVTFEWKMYGYTILPPHTLTYYILITVPFLLGCSVAMAIRVAFTYERELEKAFLFISFYLAVLLVGNLKFFWPAIYGASLEYIPLALDILSSVMLLLACIYTLRVIEVKRMTRIEWMLFALMFIVGVGVMSYPYLTGSVNFRDIIFRILNISLVMLLLPVLFLYMHQFRGEARESITFMMVIVGIIVATIADWIFEMATGTPHGQIGILLQTGSVYDVLLMLAYFTIFLGLFVHVNYEKWSLKQFESFKLD